jgi:drug/metabolite transporter (DMT)-like permease
MIALIGTIICSTLLLVIFRIFERYEIDSFQAIVVNYFTAFICGISIYAADIQPAILTNLTWIPFIGVSAILFISLFIIMAKSAQKNGIASTSVAVKMSMALSMLGMILIYKEAISFLKISGVVLALLGVFLLAGANKGTNKNSASFMLVILFFGSGLLDLHLNYAQKVALSNLSPPLFTAFGFGLAGCIGLVVYIIQGIRSSYKPVRAKNIIAGVTLGIPNFYSIYFILKSYRTLNWQDSSVLAVANVSIVILSVFVGLLVFKEQVNKIKIAGILSALLAITLLYLSS